MNAITPQLTLPAHPTPLTLDTAIDVGLPAPEALVEAAAPLIEQPLPEGVEALLALTGGPTLDMLVTPFSARAALLGASTGLAFYHHELRGRLPMPPDLEPEVAVWGEGTVPVWRNGVLEEPKYFSFFEDAPLFAYNPNHRRKWRPHEMLHAAQRFFWSPAMTRFEAYLGARINELLPVVLWYGFDEIFRPRCDIHRGHPLYREHCPACEQLAVTYDQPSPHRVTPSGSLTFARHALEHLTTEWTAIRRELETGQPHSTPRPALDASSDAIGYLRGHWNRLTAWSFGAWAERFLLPGVDGFTTLHETANHALTCTQQLVSGTLSLSPSTYLARRARRILQDLTYRLYLTLEHLDETSPHAARAEDALEPHLDHAAHLCHDLLQAPERASELTTTFHDLLAAYEDALHPLTALPNPVRDAFPALGYTFPQAPLEPARPALALLREGLVSALPEGSQRLDLDPLLLPFARSPQFLEHGRLATRFASWYATRPNANPELKAWIRLDAWLAEEPRRDPVANDFATLPGALSDLTSGTLRPHATLRRGSFPSSVIETLTGTPGERLMAIRKGDELRLLIETDEASALFDGLETGASRETLLASTPNDTLDLLLENSFLVWLPPPA